MEGSKLLRAILYYTIATPGGYMAVMGLQKTIADLQESRLGVEGPLGIIFGVAILATARTFSR